MNWKVEEKDGGFAVIDHCSNEICFERDRRVADNIAQSHNQYVGIIGFAAVAIITNNGRIKVAQTYGNFDSFDNKIAAVNWLKTNADKNNNIIIPDSAVFTEIYGSTIQAFPLIDSEKTKIGYMGNVTGPGCDPSTA